MKPSCHLVPALAATLAACGSSTTASIHLDVDPGWSGTAEVLVHHAGGALASRAPITGDLEVPIDDGDAVTVTEADSPHRIVVTALGVARGDRVVVPARPSSHDAFPQVTITLPAVAGVDAWYLATPDGYTVASFGAGTTGNTVSVPSSPRTSMPIVAVAAKGTTVLAMYGDRAAPVTAHAVDLSTHPALATTPVDVTVDNAPAGATVETFATLWFGDRELELPVPTATSPVLVPSGLADRVVLRATAWPAAKTQPAVGGAVALADPPAAAAHVDLAATAVPALDALTFDASHVAWTATGGSDYDLYDLRLRAGTDFDWILDAPPGTASIALPALPADLAPPTAFDAAMVVAWSHGAVDGYHEELAGPVAPAAGDRDSYRGRMVSLGGAAAPSVRGKLGARAVPLR